MASLQSSEDSIDRDEFESRLVSMCTQGGEGVPKKRRDRHILLAAATSWTRTGVVYSPEDVNRELEHWVESVCPRSRLDAVTLRRELVDASYLLRDQAGSAYTAGPGSAMTFEAEVASVDPEGLIRRARSERALRAASHGRAEPT